MSNIALSDIERILSTLPKFKHRVQLVAVKRLEAEMKRRIFNEGLATNGGKIGEYSERPLSVANPSINPRAWAVPSAFVASRDRNGRVRDTQFFSGGYKEFRKEQGFQTAFVDTDYTGSLRQSLQTGLLGDDIVLGFADLEQYQKSIKLEQHFNKSIYEPSENEQQIVDEVVINEFNMILYELGL